MKYICNICGGVCDPGELAGGICFDCRQEDGTLGQSLMQGGKSMKRFFQFEERVTYMHSIEVEITPEQEDGFHLFCNKVAENIEDVSYGYDRAGIADEFVKKYGGENVAFCEDGSPSVELEAI